MRSTHLGLEVDWVEEAVIGGAKKQSNGKIQYLVVTRIYKKERVC